MFGEFSSKFAEACAAAPHLGEPIIVRSDPGDHPTIDAAADGVDLVALTHNETSTGVAMQLRRPAGDALVAVDATSAAGGLRWDPADVDVYYFAPQKCFASDGGLWLAACSPAALERIRIDRRDALGAGLARPEDRPRQLAAEPDLQHAGVGDARAARRPAPLDARPTAGSTGAPSARRRRRRTCTAGPASVTWATPFVADPAKRSAVVGTIDLAGPDDGGVDATTVCAALRANGIVDTDSYRKLGRNQLRIGMFPAIEPDDVAALTACIDHVVERAAELAPWTSPRSSRLATDGLAPLHRPIMVIALRGWFDVAQVATDALDHMTSERIAPVVGAIEPDPFFDFTRSGRTPSSTTTATASPAGRRTSCASCAASTRRPTTT